MSPIGFVDSLMQDDKERQAANRVARRLFARPLLSIVTGTIDRPEHLRMLVNSIVTHAAVDWELVVADASKIPSRSVDSRIRIIHESPRLGHTRGYNVAFRAARGAWVMWLNDDCTVLPGFDVNAIEFMEAHQRIGLGALYYSNRGEDFKVNEFIGIVYANFGIIKRDLGERVGWFDEDFYMYGADNSITFRVLLAGLGVAPIPNARVQHSEAEDYHRTKNQLHRKEASEKLASKYLPMKLKLLKAYKEYV